MKPLTLAVVCCLVAKSCPTLCDPKKCSTPGFPVLNYLPEFAQMHIHWVGDGIQPSHPLLAPSPPALNLNTYIHLLIHYTFIHGPLHLPSTLLSLGMNDSTRVKKNGFWHICKHDEVFTRSCFTRSWMTSHYSFLVLTSNIEYNSKDISDTRDLSSQNSVYHKRL